MPPTLGKNHAEIRKAYCVMKTAYEMMEDRHYAVGCQLPANLQEFEERFVSTTTEQTHAEAVGEGVVDDGVQREAMTLYCERGQGEQRQRAQVFFVGRGRMSAEFMNGAIRKAGEDACQRLVFVSAAKPNAIVKKQVETTNRSEAGVRVQVFDEDDLAVNITKHALVPQHRPLDDVEMKAVLEAHALQLEQLPRLLATDPVAMYFGLQRGNVVEIKRRSESAGEYVTYRQVV